MSTAVMDDVSRETEDLFGERTPPIPGTRTGDDDAPYGFTNSGAPRGKPGRKPGQQKAAAKSAVKAIPAVPKKSIPRVPPAKKTQVDYKPALLKLGGEFIGTAAIWGLMKDDMRILADTATVANAYPSIVETVNTAADKWPVVAAILDRVLPMAEFAKGGSAIVLMAAQLGVNHGLMPPGLIPGTASPERVVSAFIDRQIAENPEFAETIAAIQQMKQQAAKPTPEP